MAPLWRSRAHALPAERIETYIARNDCDFELPVLPLQDPHAPIR